MLRNRYIIPKDVLSVAERHYLMFTGDSAEQSMGKERKRFTIKERKISCIV